MKKLLIRLALWVLRKCNASPTNIDSGVYIYFRGIVYQIAKVTQTVGLHTRSTLVIDALEVELNDRSAK